MPSVLLLLVGDRLLGLLRVEYVQAFGLLQIITLSRLSRDPFPIRSIQNVRMKVESIAKLNALRCVLLLGLKLSAYAGLRYHWSRLCIDICGTGGDGGVGRVEEGWV